MPALPFWTVFAPFTCIERPGGRTHSSHWLCVAYRASRIEWPRRHCWFDLLGCLVSYLNCAVLLHWLLLAAAEELIIAGNWPSVPCFIKGPSIRPRSHDTKKTLRHTPLQEGSYTVVATSLLEIRRYTIATAFGRTRSKERHLRAHYYHQPSNYQLASAQNGSPKPK